MPVYFRVEGEVLSFIIISRHECVKLFKRQHHYPSSSYGFYINYDRDIFGLRLHFKTSGLLNIDYSCR